ncbi:VWA domain-containing protein [Streptomyces antnestii]|uniref:VWA domain-containing protein n=1 Tax=Streptomyces antnestii TaxID=2494256 RepID=A0A437Q3D6_9ACTN|nr:VWA domain-containing protein [Streptomyces sp. San01]RVU28985.1 VWA domain-containing protein [Streptomyces sp. San01]
MTTLVPAHVHHHPPAVTETEEALARWEDDGGPLYDPVPRPDAAEWLRISAELTERLPELAGREDILVTCAPGTLSGAPAAYFPATANLEIDEALFTPHRPRTLHPQRAGDEDRYPVAWGAMIHEAAHAAHSRWLTPTVPRGTAQRAAAEMLEESRAEAAHLARRPDDRRFLRATVHTVLMADMMANAPADRWQAAFAAGLLLARRDAGILDPDESEPVETAVTAILGPDLLAQLAAIWKAAHATADDDTEAMLAHGQAWCQALGQQPQAPEPPLIPGGSGPDGGDGALTEAVGQTVRAVRRNEQAQAAARQHADAARHNRARTKAEHAEQQRQATQIAGQVFAPGARPVLPGRRPDKRRKLRTPVTGTRTPTGAERAAAGRLARALRTAAYRERTAIITASAAPPGRLNMRQALARDAQQAAGAVPSATPWIHTQRKHTPTPPLRVAIAVDVSGSMGAAAGPIASAAWILARATALTDPDSRSATVAYDRALTAITAPGRTPARVTEFEATGGAHRLAEAIDALTAGLGLDHPGAGRLLVIASDGHYNPDEAASAAARITALRTARCAVLWLAFAPGARPLEGATFLELTDPAQAAAAISTAASTALTTANRA